MPDKRATYLEQGPGRGFSLIELLIVVAISLSDPRFRYIHGCPGRPIAASPHETPLKSTLDKVNSERRLTNEDTLDRR